MGLRRAIETGICAAGTLAAGGVAVALAAETVGVGTGGVTISAMTASAVRRAPRLTTAAVFGAGALLGGLVAHFTDWEP